MHFLFLVVEFKESWNILTSLQKKLKEGFVYSMCTVALGPLKIMNVFALYCKNQAMWHL